MIGHHYHLWKGSSTYIWPTRQKGIVLTSIQAGTHPTHSDEIFPYFHLGWNRILLTMMEDFYPGWNTSYSQWWKISALTFIQAGTHPSHSDEKAIHLHPSMREHILLTVMEGLALTSDHEGTHPSNHIRMAPSPRLSYLVIDQVPPFLEWQLHLYPTCLLEWPTFTYDMEGT